MGAMDATGGRNGWPLALAVLAALAAGGVAAQESGEAPDQGGGEVVLNEEGGWEVAEGGSLEPGWDGEVVADGGEAVEGEGAGPVAEEGGEEVVWIGEDDPDSVDGWELEEAGEVVAGGDPACDGCGAEGVFTVGEDLSEGGEAGWPGSPDRPAVARGTRIRSAGATGGECAAEGLRGAFICDWMTSR